MKIFIITDVHGNPDAVYKYLDENSVDKIIVMGDVTNFGPDDLFVEILNKLSEYAEVYSVFGNCDPKNSIELLDKSQAVNIHDNIVNIENINVVGFGGSNPTPFDTLNEYEDELLYEELVKYNDVLSSDSFTILVTHAPPINTKADKIEGDIHVGSEGIRKIVEQTQPTLNICGHVHEAVAIDKIGNTTIVNPGDAQAGHACMLVLSEENIKEKEPNITLIEL